MWWAGFSLPVRKDVYGRAPTAFDSRSGASGCWVASRRVRRGNDAVAGVWRKTPFCSRRPRVSVRFCHWSLPVSVYSVCVRSPPSRSLVMVVSPGGRESVTYDLVVVVVILIVVAGGRFRGTWLLCRCLSGVKDDLFSVDGSPVFCDIPASSRTVRSFTTGQRVRWPSDVQTTMRAVPHFLFCADDSCRLKKCSVLFYFFESDLICVCVSVYVKALCACKHAFRTFLRTHLE